MITPETISDLNKALNISPEGFLVVDRGVPKFAVLDYEAYQNLKKQKPGKQIKKILVTGGAGYIGSCTVRVLQDEGFDVVVYDNLSTGKREAVRNCKLIVADLGDKSTLDKVFAEEKIDAVIHFAASIEVEESVKNPAKYYQNNVASGLVLLNAMVSHGVKRLVFSSSAAVYGEAAQSPVTENSLCRPGSPYGETKLEFENILKHYGQAYGIHSVSLRYFNAAGAWPEAGLGYNHTGDESHLIPRVLDVAFGKKPEIEIYGQDYPTPDGTGIRDFIHIRDLASAHVAALRHLGRANGSYVYNVGTGRGYSVLEVVDAAVEATGKMIPIKVAPRRAGDPSRIVAANGKIRQELGWEPKHDLASILQSAWQWHKMQNPV